MKAAVRHEYGPPEVLHVEDVPTPTPKDDEVLVRVHAASVNLGDWEILTAKPLYITVLARNGDLSRYPMSSFNRCVWHRYGGWSWRLIMTGPGWHERGQVPDPRVDLLIDTADDTQSRLATLEHRWHVAATRFLEEHFAVPPADDASAGAT